MKEIKFKKTKGRAIALELVPGWVHFKYVYCYTPVYTTLTSYEKHFRGIAMSDQTGLSLTEYLEATGETYSAFARRVPCSISYPRLLAHGLARPSYEMACRIEELTDGCVPRTRWYPAGKTDETPTTPTIEDLI